MFTVSVRRIVATSTDEFLNVKCLWSILVTGETKIDLIKNREVPEFSREKHL